MNCGRVHPKLPKVMQQDSAFGQAKQEGMHVEVQWQENNSLSYKSFRKHFPDEVSITQRCLITQNKQESLQKNYIVF